MPELQPEDIETLAWAGPALCALLALLWATMRGRRVRAFKRALAQPASRVLQERPKWLARLPREASLVSTRPLAEVLHRHYHRGGSSEAELEIAAQALSRAQGTARPPGAPGAGADDEERIKRLISGTSAHPESAGASVDALTQNLAVNLVKVLKGQKKLARGVEHAMLDSLGAGGGLAGAKAGGVLAAGLTPLLTTTHVAMAMPVLVLVGAWAGSFAGSRIGGQLKARHRRKAVKAVRRASLDLKRRFLARFPELMRELESGFARKRAAVLALRKRNQGSIGRLLLPDVLSVFFGLSLEMLSSELKADRARWRAIRKQAKSVDAVELAGTLSGAAECKALFARHPEIAELQARYEAALRLLEEAERAAA